jgi:hypothetical protein
MAALVAATNVSATVNANPAAVSVRPSQMSPGINVTLAFTPSSVPSTGTLAVLGLPPGVTTVPAPVNYNFAIASPTASTSFAFAVGASAAPGTYPITLQDATRDAGITTMLLTITPPSFSMSAAPNPIQLTIGGPARQTTVTTNAEPGFGEPLITYTLTGLPSFIQNDGPRQTSIATGYSPVPLTISATSAALAGSYSGMLTGQSSSGQTKTIPLLVIIQQPDFSVAFGMPSMSVCAGGVAASNTIQLAPLNGYTGTPTLSFTSIPTGLTFTPASPVASPMPPAQSVPFSLQAASASAGVHMVTLSASDSGAGINKTATLMITVNGQDYSAATSPAIVSLVPGGSAATVDAAITPATCAPGSVSVTVSGAPVGMTVTPGATSISAPAFAPATFSVAASPALPPGTYPITFTFASGGVLRTSIVQVMVAAAPDFVLEANPSTLPVDIGSSSTTTVSVTAVNGFNGTVLVTAPSLPSLTFSPATFSLLPGASQPVSVAVAPGATAGTYVATFSGTAVGTGVTHTASVKVAVSDRRDFRLTVTPPSATIRPSGSVTITVGASGSGGLTDAITVHSSIVPGLTLAPPTFTLLPGTSRDVTIAASALTPGSTIPVTFSGTIPGASLVRRAELSLHVGAQAPVLNSATPSALVAGSPSTVIRVAGDFLQSGAQFAMSDPSVVIEESTVLTRTLADVRVRGREDAPSGPHRLTVTNPDGGISAVPLVFLVYPASSIAAPLDVTTAAIVFPARGAMVAPGDKLYPRGLLATTGTGTIIGSWQFDGVPFDRFVVNAGGGLPVEVRAHVPLPASFTGGHRIELVVESPRRVAAPLLEILFTIDRVSRLTLLAPREGAVLEEKEPVFRWSVVPNCSGYLVEVALSPESAVEDPPHRVLRFRVAEAEWHPTTDDLKAIAGGIHRWRVRPVCAGETELEPTAWRTFALVPDEVAVTLLPWTRARDGGLVVAWRSDAAGLLQRVEFLSTAGAPVFAALTSARSYVLPRGAVEAGTAVRVSAIAPGGRVLGTSNSRRLPSAEANGVRLAASVAVELGGQVLPLPDSTMSAAQPHIAASWKGAVNRELVSLRVDSTDVTALAAIEPTSIGYDPLVALEPGRHSVGLIVANHEKEWSFTVDPPPASSEVSDRALRGDWVVTPMGTVTLVRDTEDQARTQFSAQTDIATKSFSNKGTGDVSLMHDFEDSRTVQEGRNWLFDLGAHQQTVREVLQLGFSQPDFLDQSQFLTTGLPRGGALGKVIFPFGAASYYQTFTARPAGVSSGTFGPEQRVRSAAYQLPASDRWDLRVLGIRVDDFPGINSLGGTGDAVGVFVRYMRGPALRAIFEGARGAFDPAAGSDDRALDGNAWRFALDGIIGTTTYAVNVRKTDAGFVNPANRGFTAGGVPDRIGGDLSLTKMLGLTTLSLQLRHLQDGTAPDVLLVPKTRQSGIVASVQRAFGQRVSLSVSGNATKDSGDALEELFMPKTDRLSSGVSVTLSEFSSRYNFSQTISRQDFSDRINELSENTTSAVTLTASATLTRLLSLSGVVSGNRSEGSVIAGTTDVYTAALQPALNIPRLFLSLMPRASFTKSRNDLFGSDSTSEQYQALATFAPQWFDSVVAVQVSVDWSRSQFSGNPSPAPFVRTYTGTINLHWKLGSTTMVQ